MEDLKGIELLRETLSRDFNESGAPQIVLQVVKVKQIGPKTPRIALHLSDGFHFLQVLVVTQLSHLFVGTAASIQTKDIVSIKEHSINVVHKTK